MKQKLNVEQILIDILGEPTPKQQQFHSAETRYIGYGGAKGGGKSHGVRQKATYLAFAFPGIKMLIVRKTFAELDRNHIAPLREVYAKLPPQLRPAYNDDKKMFKFPWGSTISLGYCDSEGDVWQYQGQEYDVVFIDEATRLTYFQFYHINSTVRGVNKFPKHTYLTCNPGGPGHFWVKRLFIDREYRKDENPKDFTFIYAKVWDNEPLFQADPAYHRALTEYMQNNGLKTTTDEAIQYAREHADYISTLKMGSEDEQRAYLDGDWEVFAGLYFGEFDPKLHTYVPENPKPYWRKSIALDYGLDMLAVLWFAVDENGYAWCYRELNEPNLVVSAAADIIKKTTPTNEAIYEYIAPPDMWNRRQDTGKSVAEIFAECGIPLIKAGNDRVQGWHNVKEWIKPRDVITPTGTVKRPWLLISKDCKNLIQNMQLLQHDERKKDDVATQPHEITHAPDALRYWCSRRQLSAFIKEPEQKYNFEFEKPKSEGIYGGEVTEDYLTGGY